MSRVEKWLEGWGFYVFLATFFALFLLVPYSAFQSLELTSDGFHIYSALRNTVAGHSFFYEGPTFEYMMGRHTFFSTLLLAPLVWLFKSPLVLAYASPFCHLLGTFLFFKILCVLDKERKARLFIFLLSVLYFFYPSAFFMLQTYYLFLPDQLFEPIFLLGFFAYLKGRIWVAAAMGLLILLTKEEYLPLFPFLFAFTHYSTRPQGPWLRPTIAAGFLTVFGICVSLITLLYYRHFNTLPTGIRSISIDLGTSVADLLKSLWILIQPVLLILAFAFYRKVGRYRAAAFWILFFFAYRCAFAIMAYQKIVHNHWGNVILLTTFFLSIGVFIVPEFSKLSLKDRRIFLVLCILTFFLGISNFRGTGTFGLIANTLRNAGPWNKAIANELHQIKLKMRPPEGYEYFIAPQYFIAPFMERSHLSLNFVMSDGGDIPLDRRAPLIQGASYVILPKEENDFGAKGLVQENHSLLFETARFALYGKQ